MKPLVELQNLWKTYRSGAANVHALRDLTLTIGAGEYVAIMGKSGSGKSTLLNLLGCLDRPTRGAYRLGGADVTRLADSELSTMRNERIGFIFQSFNLIAHLDVLENIEVPLFYHGLAKSHRRPRSLELARLVGLADRADHKPSQLSGGQQQRVACARALANDPLILLADEPTGNLDTATTAEILDLLDSLHARGRTIIMVTHEDDVAARAQRTIVLSDGRIESDRTHAPAGAAS